MQPVYCAGTLKTGRLAGKPCRKFLGTLSPPYRDVICPRCGHRNNSDETEWKPVILPLNYGPKKGDATEYGQRSTDGGEPHAHVSGQPGCARG